MPRGCFGLRDKRLNRAAAVNEFGGALFRTPLHGGAQARVPAHEPPLLVRLANDGLHLVERRGLGQVVVGPTAHRFDAGRERIIPREHDDFRGVLKLLYLPQRVEP